jgi:hypothetical protein
MAGRCISGKKMFDSQQLAEDMLIELWTRNEYSTGHAPIAVYKCEDCGHYHLTSRSPMNEKLAAVLANGKLKLHREANKWMDKFKRK